MARSNNKKRALSAEDDGAAAVEEPCDDLSDGEAEGDDEVAEQDDAGRGKKRKKAVRYNIAMKIALCKEVCILFVMS